MGQEEMQRKALDEALAKKRAEQDEVQRKALEEAMRKARAEQDSKAEAQTAFMAKVQADLKAREESQKSEKKGKIQAQTVAVDNQALEEAMRKAREMQKSQMPEQTDFAAQCAAD